MIKLEKIDKYFNRFKKNKIHVINNTSLEFGSKGLVALLGPSGSGKTTLLNVIGGLDKVRRGKIYINNQKITNRFHGKVDKIRNLNIGYIFQDYKLIDDMSVYDNVALVLKMIGIKDKKEIDFSIENLLTKYRDIVLKNGKIIICGYNNLKSLTINNFIKNNYLISNNELSALKMINI